VHVNAVAAAIQGDGRLVQSRFRWHERHLARGDVGRVHHKDVDPSAEPRWQRIVEISLVDLSADRSDVLPCARDGGVVDVGGVQLGTAERRYDRDADGAGAAAEVDNDRAPVLRSELGHGDGLAHEELAATTRHEDAVVDGYPEPAELSPAEDVLEWKTADPPVDHGGEVCRRPRGVSEQSCLVLGEHAACRPQPRHNRRKVAGPRRGHRHQGSDVLVK
jgi:hypothetical protein